MAYDEFLMLPNLDGKRSQGVGATITSRGRSERVVVLLPMLNIANGDWPTALHDSSTKQAFVVAIVGEEGDDLSKAAEMAKAAEAPEPPKKEEKAPEPPKSEAPPPSESKPAPPKTESKADLPAGDRIFASPIAKKIALEKGIPLAKIKGSGPEGRILREDVEKFKPEAAASSATAAAPGQSGADYVDTPISNMRRVIGQRLTQSKQELPHYYLTVDIDMGKVLKLREVFNQGLAEKGAKLSVNDFVVKATALALAEVPEANSAWLGETIRQ